MDNAELERLRQYAAHAVSTSDRALRRLDKMIKTTDKKQQQIILRETVELLTQTAAWASIARFIGQKHEGKQ